MTYLLDVNLRLLTFFGVIGRDGIGAVAAIELKLAHFDCGLVFDFSLTLEARGIFLIDEKIVIILHLNYN